MRRCRLESLGVSPPRRGIFKRGGLSHALAAGRRALAGSIYKREHVGVLVNCGVYRDGHVCEPAIATYVQHGLGINVDFHGRRTLSFDLLNGGCGMLNAVQVVSAMLQDGTVQAGMVVSSEVNSDRRPDPAFTYPASGAAAVLDLSPHGKVGFGSFAFQTREELADRYTAVVSLKQKHGRILMKRQADLEDAYLAGAGPAVDEVLEKEGLRREQVDLVVPAQISAGFLAKLPEALRLPKEKIVDLSGELADTLSTSVFLALDKARERGLAKPGTQALLLAFGSGITVGAATYRF